MDVYRSRFPGYIYTYRITEDYLTVEMVDVLTNKLAGRLIMNWLDPQDVRLVDLSSNVKHSSKDMLCLALHIGLDKGFLSKWSRIVIVVKSVKMTQHIESDYGFEILDMTIPGEIQMVGTAATLEDHCVGYGRVNE